MLSAEQEAKIREVAATATAQAPAVVVLDPLSIRDLLAALDATRGDRDRLRAALEDIDHWLIHPARSYTPHELAMEAHRQVLAALKGT